VTSQNFVFSGLCRAQMYQHHVMLKRLHAHASA
jgi:hypothetical protein